MAAPIETWVEEQVELAKPDKIYWCDGSDKEAQKLIEIGLHEEKINNKPVFHNLNNDLWPNAYLHRSHPNDVARTENLTFVCHPKKEQAGPNNNWMDPKEAKEKLAKLSDGCMKGRTMYVLPYMMGHPQSHYAKACVQVTDSCYVAVSMRIMSRMGKNIQDKIGNRVDFVKGFHSVGNLDPNERFIMHFPQDNLVWSIGSGYGGNALLGKKCIALRIAAHLGSREGWLAEHMIVVGVEDPEGETHYFLGAFPSACGKTNLALLDPILKGYKVRTMGDDIAWINVGGDGRLYAINPESGFFGVAPGTSDKTNPVMMQTLQGNKFFPTLFTNTGVDTHTNSPWWEGLTKTPPQNALDWQGNPHVTNNGSYVAHPNSRFTVSIYNCPSLSPEYDNPKGVPISGIIFGGRRESTIPLVCESLSWEHGVFLASSMGSETTTAAAGKVGVVRRDPMAMLPFCGYNMADYFNHWLSFKNRAKHLPKIFMVNWFRKDAQGNFIWPGFRENSRVIKWMLDRIKGKVSANETPIGLIPDLKDLELSGLDIKDETVQSLFSINKDEWKNEVADIEKFYSQFGGRIPSELKNQLSAIKNKMCSGAQS